MATKIANIKGPAGADGNTLVTAGTGITVTGTGTEADPYVVSLYQPPMLGVTFVTATDAQTVNIGLLAGDDGIVADWGDGSTETLTNDGSTKQEVRSHIYAAAGTYHATFTGEIPSVGSNSAGNWTGLVSVDRWDEGTATTGVSHAFYGQGDLVSVVKAPSTIADSMTQAFGNCGKFTGAGLEDWDTSKITDLSSCFSMAFAAGATGVFNGDVSGWDTSRVTDLNSAFMGCPLFNQDLSGWDTSKVTAMASLLYGCAAFDGDLSGWSFDSMPGTTNDYQSMFSGCVSFTGKGVETWDMSAVSAPPSFSGCTEFNGDVSGWDTSAFTRLDGTFKNCTAFNGDVSAWDVSNVTYMRETFSGCTLFNSDVSAWDVSNATVLQRLFRTCPAFNQDVSAWDVSQVTDMTYMFNNATIFDQDLSCWDVHLIAAVPSSFATGSALTPEHTPVWGTTGC